MFEIRFSGVSGGGVPANIKWDSSDASRPESYATERKNRKHYLLKNGTKEARSAIERFLNLSRAGDQTSNIAQFIGDYGFPVGNKPDQELHAHWISDSIKMFRNLSTMLNNCESDDEKRKQMLLNLNQSVNPHNTASHTHGAFSFGCEGQLVPSLSAETLYGFLVFAMVIDHNTGRGMVMCQQCGKHFMAGTRQKSTAKYCGSTCRSAAHRAST